MKIAINNALDIQGIRQNKKKKKGISADFISVLLKATENTIKNDRKMIKEKKGTPLSDLTDIYDSSLYNLPSKGTASLSHQSHSSLNPYKIKNTPHSEEKITIKHFPTQSSKNKHSKEITPLQTVNPNNDLRIKDNRKTEKGLQHSPETSTQIYKSKQNNTKKHNLSIKVSDPLENKETLYIKNFVNFNKEALTSAPSEIPAFPQYNSNSTTSNIMPLNGKFIKKNIYNLKHTDNNSMHFPAYPMNREFSQNLSLKKRQNYLTDKLERKVENFPFSKSEETNSERFIQKKGRTKNELIFEKNEKSKILKTDFQEPFLKKTKTELNPTPPENPAKINKKKSEYKLEIDKDNLRELRNERRSDRLNEKNLKNISATFKNEKNQENRKNPEIFKKQDDTYDRIEDSIQININHKDNKYFELNKKNEISSSREYVVNISEPADSKNSPKEQSFSNGESKENHLYSIIEENINENEESNFNRHFIMNIKLEGLNMNIKLNRNLLNMTLIFHNQTTASIEQLKNQIGDILKESGFEQFNLKLKTKEKKEIYSSSKKTGEKYYIRSEINVRV